MAAFVFAALCLSAADPPVVHVPNFNKVNDHIYRGGEPSLVGIQELGAMGVKRIIDLRESGAATSFEKEQADKLHIKYVNVPFAPFSAPSKEEVDKVLAMLTEDDSQTVFLHCRRGKDRTGTVVACYRIQHDRWDNRRALEEARQHGMSFMERGMAGFVLHFTPSAAPSILHPAGQ